ncbi:MAG: DUF4097 family beta strand repeat-containing protein [Streptosporangiaceae bacterium]
MPDDSDTETRLRVLLRDPRLALPPRPDAEARIRQVARRQRRNAATLAASAGAMAAAAVAIPLILLGGGAHKAPQIVLPVDSIPASPASSFVPARPGTHSWQIPVAGLHGAAVHTDHGSVNVSAAGSGERITVIASYSYQGPAPVIVVNVTAGVLSIVARCQAHACSHSRITIDVRLPSGLPVHASTALGAVHVTGMAGPVNVSDALGKVTLRNLSGAVTAIDKLGDIQGVALASKHASLTADLGDISVAFTTPPASLTVTDQDGQITIKVPGTTSYRVEATAQLGARSVSVPQSPNSRHVIRASSQLGAVTISG